MNLPPSIVRRCDADAFTQEDWRALARAMERPIDRRRLRHVPRITRQLVRQIAHVPDALHHPALFAALADIAISEPRWNQICVDLAAAADDDQRSLVRRARSIRGRGDLWDLFAAIGEAAYSGRPFPEAPYLGPKFLALVDAESIRGEARKMRNCLIERIPDAAMGRSAFYRWTEAEAADVQIVRTDVGWRVGAVAGQNNRAVSDATRRSIADVLVRCLGESVFEPPALDAALREVGENGRSFYEQGDREVVAEALWRIRGRAASVELASYCICGVGDHFVQFRVEFTQQAFRCEVAGHRFVPENSEWFTEAAVDLLERCGFRWPKAKANFAREVPIRTPEDCERLADFVCGVHHALWGHRSGESIEVMTAIVGS